MYKEAKEWSPSNMILKTFNVQVVASLGGRLNHHWLVTCKGEKFVLRRWSKSSNKGDIDFEILLQNRIAAMGWPVPLLIDGPIELEGYVWCLFSYLPGLPPDGDDKVSEQRARGRLLAQLHVDLAKVNGLGQRGNWRRCEETLSDQTLDRLMSENERKEPEKVYILRWHLERARERVSGMKLHTRPGMIIHGDFTPWNLRFHMGKLTGILDFELSHWDHRIGDFALSWRGKHDDVVFGYDEISPLEPEEWELLTPMWWAGLIESACHHLAEGTQDDGWIIRKLLERSPLMGRDATAFRQ